MHTTIAAAADWQFEASLSEANCKRVREYWSTMLQKNEKKCPLWCPLFVGPLFGRTCGICLNPPPTLRFALFLCTTAVWQFVINVTLRPAVCLSVCLSVILERRTRKKFNVRTLEELFRIACVIWKWYRERKCAENYNKWPNLAKCVSFLSGLGRQIAEVAGETREGSFLFSAVERVD